MTTRACFHGLILGTVSLAMGCNSPAKIKVKPEVALITEQGGEVGLKVDVQDKSGKSLPDAKVSFTALTPLILTVDQMGKIKGLASGNGQVLIAAGKTQKKYEVRIQIAARVGIQPNNTILNLGVRKGFKATVYDERDKPLLTGTGVRWTTSDPSVATVDKFGNVKTVKEGKVIITAYAGGISGTTVLTVQHEKVQADGYLGHGS